MITRYSKKVATGGPGNEQETAGRHADAGHDDACRCKEASKMTPRELIKLMISDLSFWKKAKK